MGLRELPEPFFQQPLALSGQFSFWGVVFLRSTCEGGVSSFAVARVGLPESFCLLWCSSCRRINAGDFSGHRKLAGNFLSDCFLFLKGRIVQLWCSFWYLHLRPTVLTCAMKGGSIRFVAIESKSFDLKVVGSNEDILKILEQGRGRRFSIFLPKPVAFWLMRAWGRVRKSKSSAWCNQMRLSSRFYVLEFKSNISQSSWYPKRLTDLLSSSQQDDKGWVKIFKSITGILGQSSLEPVFCIRKEIVLKQ